MKHYDCDTLSELALNRVCLGVTVAASFLSWPKLLNENSNTYTITMMAQVTGSRTRQRSFRFARSARKCKPMETVDLSQPGAKQVPVDSSSLWPIIVSIAKPNQYQPRLTSSQQQFLPCFQVTSPSDNEKQPHRNFSQINCSALWRG